MSDEGVELEYEKTQVVDVIDKPDKKAVGLRLNLKDTRWIPRSQISRLTELVLTLKNKWAAENVYGGASRKPQSRGGWRRGGRMPAKGGAEKKE